VSTVRAGSVRFRIYPQDHEPIHAHGRYAETVLVVQLSADGTVVIADRRDAVFPANARASDVRKILRAAVEKYYEIAAEWKRMQEK
jgi:hypothetical protein